MYMARGRFCRVFREIYFPKKPLIWYVKMTSWVIPFLVSVSKKYDCVTRNTPHTHIL